MSLKFILSFIYVSVFLILADRCQLDPALPTGVDNHFYNLDVMYGNNYSDVIDSSFSDNVPNIIVIIADDMGWNNIGYQGSNNIRTNALDDLANDGVILHKLYNQPMCTPTRAAFLTGKYPMSMGLQHEVITKRSNYSIPFDLIMFPEILKKFRNYTTALYGKWHLGFNRWDYTPHVRAFDEFYGLLLGHQAYFNHTEDGTTTTAYDFRDNFEVDYSVIGEYNTDLFTDKSLEFINAHETDGDPFFLQLAYTAPHTPIEYPGPDLYDSSYNGGDTEIATMIELMDNGIGEIVARLKQNETLWNNTLIAFFTDQGAGEKTHNFPLRGTKGTLWEGGVRSLGFVSGGYLASLDSSATGRLSEETMHASDWFPTLCSFAGLDGDFIADYLDLDGINQKPMIMNEAGYEIRNETVINVNNIMTYNSSNQYEYCYSQETSNITGRAVCGAIIVGDLKLLIGDNEVANCANKQACNKGTGWGTKPKPITNSALVRCNKTGMIGNCEVKMNEAPYNGYGALYNLTADPCECNDIRSTYPDLYDFVFERLEYYDSIMKPVLNGPNIDNRMRFNLMDNYNISSHISGSKLTEHVWTPYGWLNGTCTPYDGLIP